MRVNKYIKIIILLILIQFQSLYAAPKAPIDGSFVVTSDVKVSKPIELMLDFVTLRPFDKVGVFLRLPQGVMLLDGSKSQNFDSLKADHNKSLKYKVQIDKDEEYQVLATVKILNLGGLVYSKDFIVILNSKGNVPPAEFFIEE